MRKALLLLSLLPGLVWGAIGTPTSIGTNSELSASGSDPISVTTTATANVGDTVVVLISGRGNRTWGSVTDSAGNTYTSAGSANSGTLNTDCKSQVYRSRLTVQLASSGTVTVNSSGIGTGGVCVEVVKVSGVADAADATGTGSGDTGDPTGSVTTVGASTIVFTATIVELGAAPTYDEAAGWTSLTGIAAEGTLGLSFHTAYQVFASAGSKTYDPEVSGTDTTDWTMFLLSLAESTNANSRVHLVPMTGAGLLSLFLPKKAA